VATISRRKQSRNQNSKLKLHDVSLRETCLPKAFKLLPILVPRLPMYSMEIFQSLTWDSQGGRVWGHVTDKFTGLDPCHTSFLTRYFRDHSILLKDDATRREFTILDDPFLQPNLF
jgi:hypothetical protein